MFSVEIFSCVWYIMSNSYIFMSVPLTTDEGQPRQSPCVKVHFTCLALKVPRNRSSWIDAFVATVITVIIPRAISRVRETFIAEQIGPVKGGG